MVETTANAPVLLYDGVCGFCNKTVQMILERDPVGTMRFAALQSDYGRFVERAVALGGTISAEHGVGKLKREYLRALYGERHLREMAALKRAFDPACVLGRGNIFAEEFLSAAG